jgi:membrane-associated phospholipid phosphatase
MGMKRYRINWLILLIATFAAQPAIAESSDINAFASTMLCDANATFTKPVNLAALLLAGGASAILHNTDADKNINDNLHHRAFDDTTDKIFDYAGNPLTHLGATGLWYLVSENGSTGRERATTMFSALAITDAAAFGLKLVVNNDRPNGDNFSFPSAHTASSFCVASVLDEYYGPQVGIPAYLGAAMVGWRMMDSGDHWASDVLFGATLGYIVGHSVAANHKPPEFAGFRIEPMITAGLNPVTGIALVKRF